MSRYAISRPLGPDAPAYPELSEKRVLITGASNGVGGAIASAFANQGCRLVLQFDGSGQDDLSLADDLRDTAAGLRVFNCDLTDDAAAKRFSEAAVRAYQGIDVVVNNVSAVPFDCGDASDVAAFDEVIAENLMTACLISEEIAAAMQARGTAGTIVYAAEVAAIDNDEAFARYAVAKVGLEAVTQGQAWEWADDGIGVNALLAGSEADLREVAAAAVYQATEDAFWISGKTLSFGT
ncbi:MAG: SDR family NAD(P)-dependent oxidoreductase [Hyphomicrobiaceae bacterium]